MQNQLTDHIRNFVDGEVGVESLSVAAQAEQTDRETADKVLLLLSESDHGADSTQELRERARDLI